VSSFLTAHQHIKGYFVHQGCYGCSSLWFQLQQGPLTPLHLNRITTPFYSSHCHLDFLFKITGFTRSFMDVNHGQHILQKYKHFQEKAAATQVVRMQNENWSTDFVRSRAITCIERSTAIT